MLSYGKWIGLVSLALLAVGLPLQQAQGAYVIQGVTYAERSPTETVIAPFTDSDGVATVNNYSDYVLLQVSGVGQSLGTFFNDAFYVYADGNGDPIAPFNDAFYYQLAFDTMPLVPLNATRDAKNFIYYDVDAGVEVTPTYVPAYRADHTYSFIVQAGAVPSLLHFGTSNGVFADNTGEHSITVTQLEAVPEPSTLALGCMGLVGLAGYVRRRRTVAAK